MAVSKPRRHRPSSHTVSRGLVAIGSSGPWEIAIDQSLSGPDRWFAQIESPSVYLDFEILSLDIISQAAQFLAPSAGENGAAHAKSNDRLDLGIGNTTRLALVRDDEFGDRFYLVVESKAGPLVRFTLAGEDLNHVCEALRQAMEDLVDEV